MRPKYLDPNSFDRSVDADVLVREEPDEEEEERKTTITPKKKTTMNKTTTVIRSEAVLRRCG
jgi:hypothetical protein